MPKDNKAGQQAKKPADNGQAATLIDQFKDAEGQPNLEEIVEIAQGLPEALRKLPMDQLQKVMPQLQEIVAMAGGKMPENEGAMDEEGDTPNEGMADMESEESKDYADSAKFKDAVAQAVNAHAKQLATVIDKAKNFVDSGYSFAGKDADQIMRDALATQHGDEQFADAELPVAFKLLKPAATNMQNFGDGKNPENQADAWAEAADKEL